MSWLEKVVQEHSESGKMLVLLTPLETALGLCLLHEIIRWFCYKLLLLLYLLQTLQMGVISTSGVKRMESLVHLSLLR